VVAVAGLFLGRDVAQDAIVAQFEGLLGAAGGSVIEDMLASTSDFGTGIVSLIAGVGGLILGATTAFGELQDDLDRIWKAEPRAKSSVVNLVLSRLLSFGMVLVIGFLLTVSLALNAAIAAIGMTLLAEMEIILHVVTLVVSYVVGTVLFGLIYKVLPNVRIAWMDVWIGAALAAFLFEIGKVLISLYLGKSSIASSFGSAGPFVVLMIWVYYSTQILLFGAEFTAARARLSASVQKQKRGEASARDSMTQGIPRDSSA
jgi:membrane protein